MAAWTASRGVVRALGRATVGHEVGDKDAVHRYLHGPSAEESVDGHAPVGCSSTYL